MTVVLFEDDPVAGLDPVALGKPAFAIQCGSYRLFDLAAPLGHPMQARVRPHLAEIVAADYPTLQSGPIDPHEPALWINARCVPSAAALGQFRRLLDDGHPAIVRFGDAVVAAVVPGGTPVCPAGGGLPTPQQFAALSLPRVEIELPLFE